MRRTRFRRWASSDLACTYFACRLSLFPIFSLSFFRAWATSWGSTPAPNFLGVMGVAMPEGDAELGAEVMADGPMVGRVEVDSLLRPKAGRASVTEDPTRLVMFLPPFPFVILRMVWRSMPISPITSRTSSFISAEPKSFLKAAPQLRTDCHQP